jgi:hypothetical protein
MNTSGNILSDSSFSGSLIDLDNIDLSEFSSAAIFLHNTAEQPVAICNLFYKIFILMLIQQRHILESLLYNLVCRKKLKITARTVILYFNSEKII